MTRTMEVKSGRVLLLLLALALACTAIVVAVFLAGEKEAAANAPVPALPNMAALTSPETATAGIPKALRGVPADVAPSAGEVRELISGAGSRGNFSLYVWPNGDGGLCLQGSHGGGGCFAEFRQPFNPHISDPDRVGAGSPVIVWGPVTDDVAGVDVVVDGQPYPALVSKNAAFFELADGSLGPETIDAIIVRLRDGSEHRLRA